MFAICFTDQCLPRLKQSFSLFPQRKLLIWAVNSSIAKSHYCISIDVKVKCRSLSRKFHGEMRLFAFAFAKPIKIRTRLFLFDRPNKCFAFLLFSFCFNVCFSRSYERRCILSCFPKYSEEMSKSTAGLFHQAVVLCSEVIHGSCSGAERLAGSTAPSVRTR